MLRNLHGEAPPSVRKSVILLTSTAFVIAIIFIRSVHSNYLGGVLVMAGGSSTPKPEVAWLPRSPETWPSIRERQRGQRSEKAAVNATIGKHPKLAIPSVATRENAGRKDRVYCMVPFIWTPSAVPAYHAIRASWGKRCHFLRFFIDPVIGDEASGYYNMTKASDVISAREAGLALPDDVVVLHGMRRPWHTCRRDNDGRDNMPVENCRNIFEKVWRMMVHVASSGGNTGVREAEWFVKVDSDTFLFPENIPCYVRARSWSADDPHYFGHVLNHRRSDRGVSIVAGGAVFYSRAALLVAGGAFRNMPMDQGDQEEDGTCRDAYTGTEEVATAVCLNEHAGVVAEPAIDPEGREYVSLYEIDDILNYNRTDQGEWWFWEHKKRFPCHDDGDCLASRPLAFHNYKDPQALLDLEKEFYGSVAKEEEDKTLFHAAGGRNASRRCPNVSRVYSYLERIRAEMRLSQTEECKVDLGTLLVPS